MDIKDLENILTNHEKWIRGEGGCRADLRGADLRRADLSEADLSEANLSRADLSEADLSEANLSRADLSRANLSRADLRGANLSRADLRGANLSRADLRGVDLCGADLDYSALPLWCGSLDVVVDKRLAAQIAYHLCRLKCDDSEFLEMREKIKDFANQFHRVEECGRID